MDRRPHRSSHLRVVAETNAGGAIEGREPNEDRDSILTETAKLHSELLEHFHLLGPVAELIPLVQAVRMELLNQLPKWEALVARAGGIDPEQLRKALAESRE